MLNYSKTHLVGPLCPVPLTLGANPDAGRPFPGPFWDVKALKNPPPTPGLNSSLKNTPQIQKCNLEEKCWGVDGRRNGQEIIFVYNGDGTFTETKQAGGQGNMNASSPNTPPGNMNVLNHHPLSGGDSAKLTDKHSITSSSVLREESKRVCCNNQILSLSSYTHDGPSPFGVFAAFLQDCR